MQPKIFRTATCVLLALSFSLAKSHGAVTGFPAQGDDVTPSLGQFRILVATNFQAMMTGNPNYSGATRIFTSPMLYDPSTIIGRSSPFLDGSASDATGVPVGSANTPVSESSLSVQPGGLGPAGTREIHTEIRAMNMKDFGSTVAAVRGGTNAPSRPISAGEIESWSSSGNSALDFPARSFFDVFVQVDIPGGGGFPGATNLYNDMPLLVQNTNVTSFPPQVVYIHGMSTAVPIKFSNNNPGVWTNGQIFGLLMLAGHDVVRTNDAATQGAFQSALNAVPNAPVEPPYSNWAPGLTVAGTNMIFPNRADDNTTSLGTFVLAVNPAFQAAMSGNPNWNSTTKRLTSPLLYDPNTIIGRSSPLTNGSTADTTGVQVGSAGTIVASSNMTLLPPVFVGPAGTREVHTEIRSFNLAGSGAAVRAGIAAPAVRKSVGEIESLSGNSGDPYWDFPAKSFFDIFVDVDLTVGGSSFTLTNGTPLIVQNNNLTAFPPKVIYVHGNTTAVPVMFTNNVPALGANAGDTFGIILLAGHGVGFNPGNTNDVALFQQTISQMQEQPVAPQYVTWAPNLKTNAPTYPPITLTCSTNITAPATGGSSGAYVYFSSTASGGCSTPVINYSQPSGSFFPVGTTIVSCTATDTCGNSANCSFQVTVTPPPVITCPTNMMVVTSNSSGVTVNFTVDVTGACAPVTIYSYPYNSGDTFPVGNTYETVYVYDCNGYEGYCYFTVTVTNANSTPLIVNCPSNITVSATSSSGAVVNFNVDTSGGCPPIYVSTSPYSSGSTFPIGTTTESVYVYDSCVGYYVYYCSFNVTVNPPSSASVKEYFSAQAVLPPLNSAYISPAQWHVLFNNGIVIRDVRHRFFTQNYSLPALGNSQTETFNSEVDYQLSTDNGATFHPATGTANVTVQVTHGIDNNGISFYSTEMTQLDLNGSGIMLRESPTLQSTGQTTVRPVAGGYMIGSFFDIFTEVSLDGGNSWAPANDAGHMEMRPDPKQVTPAPEPTPLLPPPNDHYVSPQQWHALFAQGIVIKNLSHRLFTGSLQPPPPGVTNTHNFNSQIDLQISTDGGNTYHQVRVAAPVQVTVAGASSSSGNSLYDTEMTSLSLSGLSGGVMIRESPTLASLGVTEIDPQADGTYHIHSFFDIFPEVSLDGGASWSPTTNGPVRMQLKQQAPEVTNASPNLPVTSAGYVSPQQWHALYANGIIITNVIHSGFTQTYPLPSPGGSQTESFGSTVSGLVSMNGGASFQSFSAPAGVSVQVTSRSDLDNGNTRYFDTEMLSLNLSGGSLPGGIMVRESPSIQSLGRTSVRTDGSGVNISSFFDIFTEVSLDGGQSWSPSVTAPGTMSPGTTSSNTTAININCSSNLTAQATSSSGATVFYTVTASGGCSTPTVTANPPSGSTFPIGTSTVFASASDNCGNSAQCSFTVTVVAPPINLTCSSNITVTATSSSGATVFYNVTATGGCSPPPFVSSFPSSGSTFPVGTTFVSATASDNCGNSTNCSFTVTVNPPNYPPIVLTCPSNITTTATSSSGAVVFFNATATGGCSPPPTVTANPPSGSTFPVGTTTVFTSASDNCGNFTNCNFTVTVVQSNCLVSIFCSSNIVVTSSVPTTVFFTVTASDSCGGTPGVTSSPPSGSTFPIGSTVVFSTASDSHGTNSCNFTVTVVRPATNNPIVLNCSSNLTVTATSSSGATVFFNVTASGGCSTPTVTANPPSGSTFPVGTTTVFVTASDSCGSSTNCSFQVTVVKPPISLNCLSNITVTATSSSGATVFFNVTASGGCSPPPFVNANPPSGSTFPVGTTTVFVTASDSCGSSTNCSFQVTVVKPPISLNCSSNITVTATSSSGATVFFTLTATGGCSTPTVTANPPSGSTFPVGTTTVFVTASDTCGSSTNCSFTVHVNSPTNPPIVLNCSSNLTVQATSSSGATVFFNVTASGGCSTPTVTANPPSGSTFPVGTTTVFVTASDTCGSSTNCSFQVTVVKPPISLNCSSNITVTATSSSGATVFFNVTASGGCSTPTVTANPPSGSTFPVGTTTVFVTANDTCGSSTNCSFTVHVNSPTNPPIVLNCSSNLTVQATSSSGATVFFNVTASGGCSTPTVTANPPSGSTFPVGTTTVFVTASDTCGSSTNCSFQVTVVKPPISLNCSSNITVTATSSSGATVFFNITASGGCSTPTVTANPPSGSTFPVGTTTVFVTANDTCGSSTNCSFQVTVNPQLPQVNEYFSTTTLLPPPNTVYISPAQWHVLYANGIVIRDVRHRFFTQNYTPPTLSNTVIEVFSSELDFNLSTDNGVTYHPATGTANVTVQVTHSQDANGISYYNTEMLQLNLTGSGLMLRESPTLQSTGQTTVRPVSGGYMISSFFDIFTEVSLDGGNTWVPSQGSGHVEMRPDPLQVPGIGEPTRLLPAPNDAYVSPAQWHALYAQGIVIKNVSHKFFTGALLPPASGLTNTHSFNSVLDLDISTDGGNSYQSVRVTNAPVQVTVANSSSSTDNPMYDTEMSSLNLTLPNGVMVRESPLLPSHGMTEIDAQSNSTFHVTSFFDIFTELSLDGGTTWSSATNGPTRMQLTSRAPEVATLNGNLPLTNHPYVSPAQWHAAYANGIYITNVTHSAFTANYPPPAPGGTNTENFNSTVTGQISTDGGHTFVPFTAPAPVTVNVTSHSSLDNNNTRFFDTEMMSLNLSGGNLPGGIMVRESQTQQSVGRTSVRTDTNGVHISSFFDVFTEVSLDGGATWSASTNQPVTMAASTNTPVPSQSSNLQVTKTTDTNSVALGSGVNFYITITNLGPNTSSNITVSDVLPSGLAFAGAGSTCGAPYNSGTGVMTIPVLAAGASCTLSLATTATNAGTFTNTVTIAGASPPNTNANNAASAVVTVTLPPADLVVTKAVSTNAVGPFTNSVAVLTGDLVYFQLSIANNGPANATNVVINDPLPPGLAFVSSQQFPYNPATGVWTIGTVNTNGGISFMYLTCRATNVGTFTNIATVPVPNGLSDPNLSNNTASASVTVTQPQADLAVIKIVNRSWQNTNAQVQFIVTVTNNGPNTASNIVVRDSLPVGLTLVSSNMSNGTTYNSGTGTWSIPSLTNGDFVNLYLNVTSPNPGSFTNVANVVSSSTADPNPLNNTNRASTTFLAGQWADLAVLMIPTTNAAPVGGSILFQLTVTNLGPNSPTNVTAQLTWPAGMVISGVFGPFDGVSTFNTNTGILNVYGALVPTTAVEVNIRFTITNAGVFALNFAIASSSLPDPNTNNNSTSVTVTGLVSYAISGGTRSCSGAVLTNIPIILSATNMSNITTNTGTNGNFRFSSLLPGTYTVTPASSNYVWMPTNMVVTIVNTNVTLTNFIGLPRFITGTVLQGGTNGQPVAGVTMLLGGALSLTNMTDTNGVYIFTNLNAGTYTVTPRTNGFPGIRFTPTNATVTLGNPTNCPGSANFVTTNIIIVLRALEVIQVVQDWSNSVVLVANKATLVRAHLQLYGTNTTPILVEGARLYADKVALGGASDNWSPDNGRITVRTNNCAAPNIRSNINMSLNFTVRDTFKTGSDIFRFSWTNGIVINAEPADVAGDPGSNGQVQVSYNVVPPLGVRFIRVALTNGFRTNVVHGVTNIVATTNVPTAGQIDEQKNRLISIYPISQITNLPYGYFSWNPARGAPTNVEGWLLWDLNAARLTSTDTNGVLTNRIWYGVVPQGVSVRGLGYVPGSAAEGCISASPQDYQRHIAGHEIGHALGRPHAIKATFGAGACRVGWITGHCEECAPPGTPDFPMVDTPTFGFMPTLGPLSDDNQVIWGYDHYQEIVISPYYYYDLMSYCYGATAGFAADALGPWPWNSKFTYTNLYGTIQTRFSAAPPPLAPQGPPEPGSGGSQSYLLVRGQIDGLSGDVTFNPCYPIPNALPVTSGPFTLVELDTNAVPLYSLPFAPDVLQGEQDEQGDATTTFDLSVPIIPGAAAIEIYSNAIPIGELVADAYAPTVNVLHPNGGENFGNAHILASWTGSDPDGSPLKYLVQFSPDGGSSWDTLAIDWDQTNLDIPPDTLPATTNGLIRVIASDGLNTYTAQSAGPFTITPHVPSISILQPGSGALFYGAQTIVLEADAYDLEDGSLDGTNVLWTSSRDGALGSGDTLPLETLNLHEGIHLITATAIANSGLTNSASVQITVLRLAPPQLSIQLTNSNQILVSWPTGYTNYLLESTTSLLPSNWTTVTNAPVGTNLLQTVNLNLSTTNRFFRLRMP